MMDYENKEEGEKKSCSVCGHAADKAMESMEGEDGTGRKSIPIDRVDDIPDRKVKRTDGLPTVDDLKEMMGQGGEAEPSMGDKVGNMVEIILKIK